MRTIQTSFDSAVSAEFFLRFSLKYPKLALYKSKKLVQLDVEGRNPLE